MSSTTSSASGSVAARASAAITTTAAPPAAASVGRCTRSPVEGACSRQSGRKSGTIGELRRFEEAKALLRKMMPVAPRVLGDAHFLTLNMRANYARTLNNDPKATLDDIREAVTTLQDAGRTARRVLGGANPTTVDIEGVLQIAQSHLRARERQSAAGRS